MSGNEVHKSVKLLAELEADEPRLPQDCEIFWKAFKDCSSMRPSGMAVCKLRWDDVMKWAKHYNLTSFEADILWNIISEMDSIVIDHSKGAS